MRNYGKYSNGRMMFRNGNGRFAKPTFKELFGVEANAKPLVCGKCGYGGNGEFIPILRTGYCPKCRNQDGHYELERSNV